MPCLQAHPPPGTFNCQCVMTSLTLQRLKKPGSLMMLMTLTRTLPTISPATWNFQLPVCDDQPYLIEAEEAQVLDDTDCTDACLAHDLTRHLQADFDNLQRVGEHHLRAARLHNSSHYHEWGAQDARAVSSGQ